MSGVERQQNGCWRWTRYTDKNGYGRTLFNGKLSQAHRAMYQLLVGEIPAGMQLDHLCMNPPCCNPSHLEPVTAHENHTRYRATVSRVSHCRRGHEYSEENTYWHNTQRTCRKCAVINSRNYLQRKAEKS